jgi:DNA repair exonuclease SbcCD ATPase subunit
MQVKELRSTVMEEEQRNILKMDQYVKENQTLKNQIELLENQLNGRQDFSSTSNMIKMEQMSQKIQELEHHNRIQLEDTAMLQRKYEALLQDKSRQLELLKDADPEQLKKLKDEYQSRTEKHQAYIVELETKLEWYIENQDIANEIQSRIERYEKAVEEITRLQDGKLSKTRSASDIKRIKLLENQLKDFQSDQKLAGNTLPKMETLMATSRPSITPEETLHHLKRRIHTLEGENSKMRADFTKKVKDLELEVEVIDVAAKPEEFKRDTTTREISWV